ncbi:MAG: family 20 glycosylhydrolase [Balneolaceae bacterium]
MAVLGASKDFSSDERPGYSPAEPSEIEVTWSVISNFDPPGQFRARFTFHNTGNEPLQNNGWTLYLNSIRALNPDSFLPEFVVTHINGGFFKIEPTERLEPIMPGESRVIEYTASHFAIKITDAPEGLYFVFDDGSVRTVEQVHVEPFVSEEQVNRSPNDRVTVPDAENIYKKNRDLVKLDREQVGLITPAPVLAERGDGIFELDESITIFYEAGFENEARFLADRLEKDHGLRYSLERGTESIDRPAIVLRSEHLEVENEEAYRLEVTSQLTEIAASNPAGVFYGVQSLRSLAANSGTEGIAAVTIEDAPQFSYRGMHLDVARNFQPEEDVKKLLDVMAMYKLNTFHFHLTDDEGWRLAIDPLPELTEVGGRRGHTETESDFLAPAYGSGPDPAPGASFGSGWYTREQYIDLLQYAAERHINVIPEVDIPGHARSAIIAMKARAERLQQEGRHEEAEMYRLDEEEDRSEYISIQSYDDNVINICRESTYRFLDVVFDEIVDMHAEANAPLTTIHIGADEVPAGAWEESPSCRILMEENGLESTSELQVYFYGLLNNMLKERGLKMAGWEEIAFMGEAHGEEKTPNPELAGSAIPHVWSNTWGSGTEDYAYVLANMGYQVVMSHASNFYFDMAYNKDYREPGFYWAAMFDTREPFSFIPFDLYKNAITNSNGMPIAEDYFDDAEKLTEEGKLNILGLQGQLWTETVNQKGRMDYMIYPKLLALAERAWTGNPEWSRHEDREQLRSEADLAWNEFANRLGQFEFERLCNSYPDINYRIPPAGAVIENNMLTANTDFPGLEIRYTVDGNEPAADSPLYEEPLDVTNAAEIKLGAFNKAGRSGRITVIKNTN